MDSNNKNNGLIKLDTNKIWIRYGLLVVSSFSLIFAKIKVMGIKSSVTGEYNFVYFSLFHHTSIAIKVY